MKREHFDPHRAKPSIAAAARLATSLAASVDAFKQMIDPAPGGGA